MSRPEWDGTRLRALLEGTLYEGRLTLEARVDSTNQVLRRRITGGPGESPEGTAVLAAEQTAGRGRFGRRWHSAAGRGLYASVLFRPHGHDVDPVRYTLAASVAACEACRDVCGAPAEIEWPNDLVAGGRKLGGSLTEARRAAGRGEIVVGTGINLDHDARDFPPELRSRATSLTLLGAHPDRERLAAAYLRGLAALAAQLETEAGRRELLRRWSALAVSAQGEPVRVRSGRDGDYDGVACGITELGLLRVRRRDGSVRPVHPADSVSFREPERCC